MNININLIGHDNSFNNLVQLYNKNILPNKIIIKGNKGIGKFLLCSHFVNYVLSQDEEYKYNLNKFEINIKNKSYQLFKNEIHPNINIINKKKDSRNIEISQIREMFLFQNRTLYLFVENKLPEAQDRLILDFVEGPRLNSIRHGHG